MKQMKRVLAAILVASVFLSLAACSGSQATSGSSAASGTATSVSSVSAAQTISAAASNADFSNYMEDTNSLTIDNTKWNYDKDNNVYYQIKVAYCSNPESANETMGIYVPGEYMTAKANGDGTYTCTINASGTVSGLTAKTAPVVFPVNTPGYASQTAPSSYSYNDISSYIKAGYIYICAGMRGRSGGMGKNNTSSTSAASSSSSSYDGGAPWGVTDLKSAIRYYRFNSSVLPGSTDRIFTFGMSGGGAQSAVVGATGDSSLYFDYLESIGSAMYDKDGKTISDAISGAMCWCPITSLDYANEAYEWNMGQFTTTGTRASTTWTSALSKDLAAAYATYINQLGLKDLNGNALTLEQSGNGVYTSGSYYNYLMTVIEESLNNFMKDTTFPYTPSFGGMGAPGGGMQVGNGASNGQMPSGAAPSGMQGNSVGSSSASSTTYQTLQDYINSLNSDVQWVTYDAATKTAKITSLEAFVQHCKNASKSVGAFDDLKRSQAENNVFGIETSSTLHFDATMATLLQQNASKYSAYSDWDSTIGNAYANDLKSTDQLGHDVQYRANMYNPMYYLSSYYKGYNTSKPATYWRIRTGIDQGDTALTTETNLALALQQNSNVKSVDFATVWGLGHTEAERTGDSTSNFIAWVNQCVSGK